MPSRTSAPRTDASSGPREEGLVYFESESQFQYHNDPVKTAESRHPQHPTWSTLGDIGWLDEDGYLYLTDRKSFMIISGGVNIYPQEIENLLVTHPKVADAAVIGAPDPEMGEKVVAVVSRSTWPRLAMRSPTSSRRTCAASSRASRCPRRSTFAPELPRHPTGKLYKRLLRDEYWGKEGRRSYERRHPAHARSPRPRTPGQ
jgi:acyl-CoA synthetase (AMP-forming)/AMP-acid ligase II